ncbi:hypothetical protein GI475_20005 [Salmonella enterica]|nr:hypothetical protein [Salmonella enterica]
MTAFVGSTQTNLTFSFEQKADTGRKKAACGGFHLEENLCIAFTIQGNQIREDSQKQSVDTVHPFNPTGYIADGLIGK